MNKERFHNNDTGADPAIATLREAFMPSPAAGILSAGFLVGLYLVGRHSHVLFHSLAELFPIIISCGIFIVAWNSRSFTGNNYLGIIGTATLFSSVFETLHIITYKYLGLMPGMDWDRANQLWVASRYVLSASFLIAPLYLKRRLSYHVLFAVLALVSGVMLLSIFHWDNFPVCFVEGTVLTPFKRISEYLAMLFLAVSLALTLRRRTELHPLLLAPMAAAIVLLIVSEFLYSLYSDEFGASNVAGHYLQIIAFILLYRAIIENCLKKPYLLLFRELRQANQQLEQRVEERTAKLHQTIAMFGEEIARHQETEKALSQTADELQDLYNNAPCGYHSLDSKGVFVMINDTFLNQLGYSREEVIGKLTFARIAAPSCVARFRRQFARFRKTGLMKDAEYDVVRKDGSILPILLSATAQMEDGVFVRSRGTTLDNTEQDQRRQVEQALQNETMERLKAMEVLREKDRLLLQQSRLAAMGEMINNIAHQWRQPLNTLGMGIQKLDLCQKMGTLTPALVEKTSVDSMKLILHMSQTIDDFRSFFRPDQEKSEFSISSAIRQTVSLVDDSFRNHRITVSLDVDEQTIVNGYPSQFCQALLNVVLNARDAIVERGITGGHIAIRSFSERGCAVITINDNAGGIPADIIDKVFEPYFSTKGLQGTGIGLFMSKNIIESSMGGTIDAGNTANGAEFTIRL